jgi:hypothetical protein
MVRYNQQTQQNLTQTTTTTTEFAISESTIHEAQSHPINLQTTNTKLQQN